MIAVYAIVRFNKPGSHAHYYLVEVLDEGCGILQELFPGLCLCSLLLGKALLELFLCGNDCRQLIQRGRCPELQHTLQQVRQARKIQAGITNTMDAAQRMVEGVWWTHRLSWCKFICCPEIACSRMTVLCRHAQGTFSGNILCCRVIVCMLRGFWRELNLICHLCFREVRRLKRG
jgi:hypothetical protein